MRAPLHLSVAPMEKLQVLFNLFLLAQGGGVGINEGEVTFTSCNIYENTAGNVRAAYICSSPRWIAADGPARCVEWGCCQ